VPILVAVAIAAGALTTISGFGGGLVLLLAVAALYGPKVALAATTVALLVGNLHRIWLYRSDVGTRVTVPLLIGLVPGSLAGAWFAAAIPERTVHIVMLVVVLLSLARAWFHWEWRPNRRFLVVSGAVIGALAGSAGGAGFLVGPLVLAAGLEARKYLATVAVSAVAMHIGRIAGYGAGGLMTAEVWRIGLVLVPGLLVGNLLGNQLRDLIPDNWQRRIELGAPALCVALALVGLG
jgi:uncharacterized membrane protein YfcA